MPGRLSIRMSQQEIARAMAQEAVGVDPSQLHTLAQLAEQIEDALLVVEHPQLAARLLAAQADRKVA
jgi:hypothetical protein